MLVKLCEICYRATIASDANSWLIKTENIPEAFQKHIIKFIINKFKLTGYEERGFKLKELSLSESGDFLIYIFYNNNYANLTHQVLATGDETKELLKIIEPFLTERARKYQDVVLKVAAPPKTKTDPPLEIKLPPKEKTGEEER